MIAAKPRIGVVGAGAWGRNIVRNCADAGVLSAICDQDASGLTGLASEHPGVKFSDDYERFLEFPIDAVVIATPACRHAEMALAAIERRKHVFVEKPFALCADDANAIVTRADSQGVRTFAGHLLLYHPAIDEIRRHVSDGAIGELRHVRSRRLGFGRVRDFENVWWSFAPHDVAVMLALTGATPIGCTSNAVTVTTSAIADFCYADYRFAGGVSAHVEVGWLDPVRSHRLDVVGTRGTLTFADSRDGANLTLYTREIVSGPQGRREARMCDVVPIPIEHVEPLRAEIDAFIASIETGVPAVTAGRSAVEVTAALAMAEACSIGAATV